MSGLALLLAIAAATADPAPPTIPPATLDDELEVDGTAVDARRISRRMAVDVAVNGRGPFRFVVDSGADRSVVGAGLAARLALPPAGVVTLRGIAGTSRVATVRVDMLTVGGSAIPDIVAPALAERDLGAQGLLGIDALAGQRLMLDFEKRTVTVQDARVPPRAVAADEIVVTARRRNGQLILTQVGIGRTRLYAVIDTGSQVTIGNMALLRRLGPRRASALVPVTLVGVTGQTIVAGMTTVPELRIGRATLKGVPVAFADVPPFALFGLAAEPALLLGTDTLEAFARLSLDFRARRVRFVPRR